MVRLLVRALLVATVLGMSLTASPAVADTAVMLVDGDASVFGVNVDTAARSALVAVNRVGVRKTAIVPRSGVPDVWFSDHASLTVNPFGLELPSGGFNDAGLAIQAVWLDAPPAGATTASGVLETLQWIQYCLDGFTSVAEVAQSARASRIIGKAPVQILACQPDGRCGLLESVDGTSVVRVAEELPVPVLTGIAYREGLEALNRTLGYGGAVVDPVGPSPGPRFARGARAVHVARTGSQAVSVAAAFTTLDDLAVDGRTRWQLVSDLRARTLHVRVDGEARPWTLSLGDQATDCPTPQMVADLAGDRAGRVRPFSPSDDRLIEATAKAYPATRGVAPADWQVAADYPARIECEGADSESP
jgi:hypothetical protein